MKLERELMRGAGPTAVMKLLSKQEMYGYELVEAISEQSQGVLAMGQSTLYPMLYNLESKGYIDATWRNADNGRKRKYYSLTKKGKKKLKADMEAWERLTHAMSSIGVIQGAMA